MDGMSLDAQAIVLLTAWFNKGDKPLTVTEYARLAEWMKIHQRRPSDLLSEKLEVALEGWQDKKIDLGRIRRLLDRGNAMAIALQKWQNAGIWILTRADTDYPARLKKKLGQKAPPLLYGAGEKWILKNRGAAIVGARHAGPEELEFAYRLGQRLAAEGYSVVSGAARGVDESSMIGSIEAEGTTIGVVSDSLMKKMLSRTYRRAILQHNLLLLSPYHPEARFSVGNAMGRNKYLYALSDAAVVVYSEQKGGTWTGAVENLKHHWVPLFVKKNEDSKSGNMKLIEQGGIPYDDSMLDNVQTLFAEPMEKSAGKETLKEDTETEKDTFFPAQAESVAESMPGMKLSLEKRIVQVLGNDRLTIREIAEKIDKDEKEIKKAVNQMVKFGDLEKHRNRPLKFSVIPKLF